MVQNIFTNFVKRHQLFEPEVIEPLSIYEEQSEYQLILEGIFRVERGDNVFFGSHKSFDTHPLNDLELADSGLHVARHIFANYEHNKRKRPLNNVYPTEWRNARELFDSEGLIIIKDFLDDIPRREVIKDRLKNLWNYERFSSPSKHGKRYFFRRNDGLQNHSVLYTSTSLNGTPREVLDPIPRVLSQP